jgi:hypothetical protein
MNQNHTAMKDGRWKAKQNSPPALLLRQLTPLLVIGILLGLLAVSCKTPAGVTAPDQKVEVQEDSLEYELIIWDAGFESYLASQPPASFYAQSYYESWNRQYVQEWNYRHSNSGRYGRFYQTWIDYDPHKDYGLELNYRLYYYFQFIRERYGIVLIHRRG